MASHGVVSADALLAVPASATETVIQKLNRMGPMMKPHEVAELFLVDPKTVTRWAAAGRITCIRTPGGHRRFDREEIRRLLLKGDE